MKKYLFIMLCLSGFVFGQNKLVYQNGLDTTLTNFLTDEVDSAITAQLGAASIGDADSLGSVAAADYVAKSDSGTVFVTPTSLDTTNTDVETNATAIALNTTGRTDAVDSLADQRTNIESNQTAIGLRATITDPTFIGEIGIGSVNISETELGILEGATLSTDELNYVDGVSSAIQDQLDLKAALTSPTFATSIGTSYLTASEIVITDASKNIVSAPVATYPSLAELAFLKGASSNLQTQITNLGAAAAQTLTDGYIYLGSAANVPVGKAVTGDIAITNEGVVSLTAGAIVDADVGAAANITATKLGTGLIDNTELNYLNGVTSAVQTQLTTNAGNISTNATGISNAADTAAAHIIKINANTTNIATNVTNIGTNTSNISGLTTLADGKIYMGNAGNVATEVTPSGDATISNAGVIAITGLAIVNGDINGSAAIDASKIADGTVSSTEYQYINSLTSNAQTQITTNISDIDALETLADGKFYLGNGSNVATEVTLSGDITSTNAGVTSITAGSILNADINASANIDATKLGTGVISNTELNYLNGVTSAIQTQIDSKATIVSVSSGSYSIPIKYPQDGETTIIKAFNFAYTIDSVTAVIVTDGAGTQSIPIQIVHNGTDLFASNQTVDAYTTYAAMTNASREHFTSFSDATVAANEGVFLETGTATGTVLDLLVNVYYTKD